MGLLSSPRQIDSMPSSCLASSVKSSSGSRVSRMTRCRAPSSIRAPRKRRCRQIKMTPTLTNSPLSTRGTTRMTAYSYEHSAGIQRLLYKAVRRAQPVLEIRQIRCALLLAAREVRIGLQPILGDQGHDRRQCLWSKSLRQAPVGSQQIAGKRQQYVILHLGKTTPCARKILVPGMVEVQRGAMVYKPDPAMPDQQIGIARRTIHVGDKGVEPDDLRGQSVALVLRVP